MQNNYGDLHVTQCNYEPAVVFKIFGIYLLRSGNGLVSGSVIQRWSAEIYFRNGFKGKTIDNISKHVAMQAVKVWHATDK